MELGFTIDMEGVVYLFKQALLIIVPVVPVVNKQVHSTLNLKKLSMAAWMVHRTSSEESLVPDININFLTCCFPRLLKIIKSGKKIQF